MASHNCPYLFMKGNLYLAFTLLVTSASVLGQVDFARPFEESGISGSITLYDYWAKMYLSNELEDSQVATLPASTFKIISSPTAQCSRNHAQEASPAVALNAIAHPDHQHVLSYQDNLGFHDGRQSYRGI